jgi:hypothetical protein
MIKIITMHISTFNVRELTNDSEKLMIVLHYLQIMQMNMIVLTEFHLTIEHIAFLTEKYSDKSFFINSSYKDWLRVTIMILNYEKISKNFISIYYNDEQKKVLKIKCQIENFKKFKHILDIYALNEKTENVVFFSDLFLTENVRKTNIILKDFNRIKKSINRFSTHAENRRVIETLRAICESKKLIDDWRNIYSKKRQFIYNVSNDLSSSNKIDRLYVINRVLNKSYDWKIFSISHINDHKMISMKYNFKIKIDTESDQWYMNVNYFKKSIFRNAITKIFEKYYSRIMKNWTLNSEKQTYEVTDSTITQKTINLFNEMMIIIRSISMKFQKAMSILKNKIQKKLKRRILKQKRLKRTTRKAVKIRNLNAKLKAFLIVFTTNRTMLTQIKWISYEKSQIADFWTLENASTENKTMLRFVNKKDHLWRKSSQILNVIKTFYKKLYAVKETSSKTQLKLQSLLSIVDFSNVEKSITLEKTLNVMRNLFLKTVSRSNDISNDFYKRFFRIKMNE